jgi:hypothetical protein
VRKELKIKKIDGAEEIKEFAKVTRMRRFGGFAVENSRLMVSWISYSVKYYFSSIIGQTLISVRKILQREENKGVELTVCHGNGLRDDWGRKNVR